MFAGFWKRTVAYILDHIIFTMSLYIVSFIYVFAAALLTTPAPQDPPIRIVDLCLFFVLVLGLFLFYYVYLESSPWQATVGKLALGIKVTDKNGNRISFGVR